MYEQSFFHGRITAIETEHATREAERRRQQRERAGVPERRDGLIRRMRAAAAGRHAEARARAASVARDVRPCADCPAAA
ncbi:MAG: hypothetical protein LBU78_11480 [Microbacterium sp.]|jgi:hypothetical protein|nr:hypothetical protein [Microbacterium sp.]